MATETDDDSPSRGRRLRKARVVGGPVDRLEEGIGRGGSAALALLLTAIGIFGVMAQAVAQRTGRDRDPHGAWRTGARRARLVLRRAAVVTAAGIVIGAGLALLLTRLLAALLYGVDRVPGDVRVGRRPARCDCVVAGYIPARRATRVDAIAALRAK